ncbi:MAG: TIGR03564 family F420-dependent LLM class oxidoreductase [Gammaproteobacteria bacterium]|nr:TIGR03564 family F420-dependent LLM class oxidoreductase [Gammaproteobacteria bacterium]
MRFGLMTAASLEGLHLEEIIATARQAEAAGFDSLWMANIFSLDAISTLGLVGRETQRIELGTAVTPTYPRHPVAMAQQALTTAQACSNRFVLGLGVSHRAVIEDLFGLSFAQPARHMREYLAALRPLLRGEVSRHVGAEFQLKNAQFRVPNVPDVPVVVAALGRHMLRLTGELADGTSTWMVGPVTMKNHIVPQLMAGALAAGRPAPRVIGGFPVVLTTRVDAARAQLARLLAMYGQLPSYRSMLDREGLADPAEIALVGDEAALRVGLQRLRDSGVTDFNAAIIPVEVGAYARTFDFLAAVRHEFS